MPLHASDEPQNTGNSATAATAATVSVEHGLKNLELQRPPSMSMSLPPRDGGGAPFAQSTYGTASSTLHVNHWSTSTSSTSPSLPTPSDDGGDYLSDSRRSRQAPPASGASSASQVAPATASSALLLSVLRDKIQQREAMRRMLAQLDDEITQTMSLAVGDASDVTQSGGGGGHLSSAAHENVALAQHGNDSGDTDMAMNLSRPVLTQRRSSAAVFNGQAVVTTAGLPTVMPSQATTTAMVASPMASGAPSETLGSCLPNAKNNPCHRFDKADCQTMREMVHTAAATGTSTATLAAIACPISVNGSSAAEAGYPSQPGMIRCAHVCRRRHACVLNLRTLLPASLNTRSVRP